MTIVTTFRARIVAVGVCGVMFVLGLIIIIPLALISSSAGGRCVLYADRREYGPSSVCAFPLVVATLFHVLTCLARAALTVLVLTAVIKKTELLDNKLLMIGCGIVDVIACLLTLVSGGVISHGFSFMCSEVFHPYADRCGSLDIYSSASSSFLQHYYKRLKIAEAGVWISWLLWIALMALDIFLLWKADLLTLPSQLPFSLPNCPIKSRRQHTGSVTTREDNQAADGEQPRRVGKTHIFRTAGDVDGGSRTPPPRRPVPPRPPVEKY